MSIDQLNAIRQKTASKVEEVQEKHSNISFTPPNFRRLTLRSQVANLTFERGESLPRTRLSLDIGVWPADHEASEHAIPADKNSVEFSVDSTQPEEAKRAVVHGAMESLIWAEEQLIPLVAGSETLKEGQRLLVKAPWDEDNISYSLEITSCGSNLIGGKSYPGVEVSYFVGVERSALVSFTAADSEEHQKVARSMIAGIVNTFLFLTRQRIRKWERKGQCANCEERPGVFRVTRNKYCAECFVSVWERIQRGGYLESQIRRPLKDREREFLVESVPDEEIELVGVEEEEEEEEPILRRAHKVPSDLEIQGRRLRRAIRRKGEEDREEQPRLLRRDLCERPLPLRGNLRGPLVGTIRSEPYPEMRIPGDDPRHSFIGSITSDPFPAIEDVRPTRAPKGKKLLRQEEEEEESFVQGTPEKGQEHGALGKKGKIRKPSLAPNEESMAEEMAAEHQNPPRSEFSFSSELIRDIAKAAALGFKDGKTGRSDGKEELIRQIAIGIRNADPSVSKEEIEAAIRKSFPL